MTRQVDFIAEWLLPIILILFMVIAVYALFKQGNTPEQVKGSVDRNDAVQRAFRGHQHNVNVYKERNER